jgi:hypothetical protein
MQDDDSSTATAPKRPSWNKGKLIGPKPPLRPKHLWSIRTKLQLEGRTRDLAMFNLAIDSPDRLAPETGTTLKPLLALHIDQSPV